MFVLSKAKETYYVLLPTVRYNVSRLTRFTDVSLAPQNPHCLITRFLRTFLPGLETVSRPLLRISLSILLRISLYSSFFDQ